MIAEAAALGRAAARARDCVPAVRQRDARPAGARIDVNHGPAGQSRKIDRAAVGRRQRQIRRPHAGEVPGAAVIARHRQIRWKVQRIVEAHLGTACRPAISITQRDINCADPARSKAASAPALHRKRSRSWISTIPAWLRTCRAAPPPAARPARTRAAEQQLEPVPGDHGVRDASWPRAPRSWRASAAPKSRSPQASISCCNSTILRRGAHPERDPSASGIVRSGVLRQFTCGESGRSQVTKVGPTPG